MTPVNSSFILALHEGHNSSAAIACGGRVLAAVAEERFCGKKNYMGFPYHAATYCLEEASVPVNQVKVAMVTQHLDPLIVRIARSTTFSVADHIRQQHEYFARLHRGDDEISVRRQYAATCPSHHDPPFYDFSKFGEYSTHTADCERFLTIRRQAVTRWLGVPQERIDLLDHHTCHASYGYGASNFRGQDVLVLTADCIGDGLAATAWLVDARGRPRLLQSTRQALLGYIWRHVTLCLGMVPLSDEQKVMGLAPYGVSGGAAAQETLDSIERIEGCHWRILRSFHHYFDLRQRLEGVRFDHLAAGLQAHTEKILADWLAALIEQTGARTVVFSGGLALNVKANGRLVRETPVEQFCVPPGGSDESLPLGACYLLSNSVNRWDRAVPLESPYLGPQPTERETRKAAERCREAGLYVGKASPERVAHLLAQGCTVGRCCGRMEFGPRALGNRSILARADIPGMAHQLNEQVKHRDWWMPFAPLVRAQNADRLLDNPKAVDASFMTLCFPVTEYGRAEIAAAIHPIDGSSRPQVLQAKSNPELEAVLRAYEQLTGRCALINTSFNLHGKPIVGGVEAAVDTFLRTTLDALLLPGLLIVRSQDR